MQTASELFVHEISALLDAERRLVKALTELELDSVNPDLKKGFGEHRRQTEQHVKRIQQVFKSIGKQPQATECKGIMGLIEERESFKRDEDASPDILDIVNCGAAIKAETYEICAYNSVISLAEQLDLEEALDLLQQNLSDEEEALEKMQDIQDQLQPEELGSDDDEDDDDDEEDEEDDDDGEDEEEDDEDDEDAEEEQPKKDSRTKSPTKVPQKGKSRRVA